MCTIVFKQRVSPDSDDDLIMPAGPPPAPPAEEGEDDSDDDIPMPDGPPPGKELPLGTILFCAL